MRPASFHPQTLRDLLLDQTVATMPELLDALGTTSRQTVLRKLAALDYITSYSHRRSYYALRQAARFNHHGLWSHGPARFSRHGTLLATVEALVRSSAKGRTRRELDDLLGVATKDPLRKLATLGRIARRPLDHRTLHCSPDPDRARRQLKRRQAQAKPSPHPADDTAPAPPFHLAQSRFFGLLDERLRRLYAGTESLRFGRGGDRHAALTFGLHPSTVRRGRLELLSGEGLLPGRVRKPGGGRKPAEKKTLQSSSA